VDIYGAFEVHDSSWIRELRKISGTRIEGRHFILTFHDITFDCIAHGFTTSMHRKNPPLGLNQTLQSDARRSQSSCHSERTRGISKDLSLETSRDVWSSFDMTS
jgi:hypothetical protein